MISPTVLFAAIVGLINSLQIFDQPYIMTQGGPGNATNTVVMTLYEAGFENLKFGYASAISVFLFVAVLILTAAQFRISRRWVYYSSAGRGVAMTSRGPAGARSAGSLSTLSGGLSSAGEARWRSLGRRGGRGIEAVLLTAAALIVISPVLWMISTSLRTPAETLTSPLSGYRPTLFLVTTVPSSVMCRLVISSSTA